MKIAHSIACAAVGFGLGIAGVAVATTPAPVYSVGIEYCNGKGQTDQYDTIRAGVSAYKVRLLHAKDAPGSYQYVVFQRRTAPGRPFYEVDHQVFPCPKFTLQESREGAR